MTKRNLLIVILVLVAGLSGFTSCEFNDLFDKNAEFTLKSNALYFNNYKYNFIAVEGGTFQMGSTDGNDDEQPVHSVTLNDYYIGETEVTQALWLAVMGSWPGSSPSSMYGVGDDFPAYYVSWEDCRNFIMKLNSITGLKFRLPTEAEWEFAARGGNAGKGNIYSGSNIIDDVAWYSDNSENKTHVVKTKLPNELGIYDMSGNVFEWCQDCYGEYAGEEQTNPIDSTGSTNYVFRGGSWCNDKTSCRVTLRNYDSYNNRYYYLGFRLVLEK